MAETIWNIKIERLAGRWHWTIVRNTCDSKYQKDGDENERELALAAALSEISDFERLDEVSASRFLEHVRFSDLGHITKLEKTDDGLVVEGVMYKKEE